VTCLTGTDRCCPFHLRAAPVDRSRAGPGDRHAQPAGHQRSDKDRDLGGGVVTGVAEKIAKDEKRSADVVALQAEKKAAEREKDLIQRRGSLREGEIELEKKRAELAEVRRQALESE
jgi:hypothetical protein